MALRIGTRRSRLARAQAGEVAGRLEALGATCEMVPIRTSGDAPPGGGRPPRPGAAGSAGVKGLFVGEIVEMLLHGAIDVAVHSAKDLPSDLPDGVLLAAVPPRVDPADVLVTREGTAPGPARIGTSSLRRRAQLLRAFPEWEVVDVRGNVDTRLAGLDAGRVDGLVLAAAGLARLGVSPPRSRRLTTRQMMPAPGQGALAVQARSGDEETLGLLRRIDDAVSHRRLVAEMSLVRRLGGGCALPLGALAEVREEEIVLEGVVLSVEGDRRLFARRQAPDPEAAAELVAAELLSAGAGEILARATAGR